MENIKKLESLLEKLTELHDEAIELADGDTAHAISVAEDTLINTIKFEKDIKLAQAIVNKNKGGWKYDSNI